MDLSAAWDIFTFAAGAGLSVAIFNQAIQWLRDRRARKRAAIDFALKCAAILERFAHACLDEAAKLDRHAKLKGDPSSMRLGFPDLEPYPDDQNGWLGLKADVAATLINLQLEVENKRRQCSWDSWFEDPHTAMSTYEKVNTILAADAWFAAKKLREDHGLPSHGKIDAREPEQHTTYFLEHRLNDIHSQEAAFQKSQRVVHDRLLEAQHEADLKDDPQNETSPRT